MPTLYIIAGPNGSGKSTSYYSYIPSGVDFVNTDEISKKIKIDHPHLSNTQELANAKALEIINGFISNKRSYGIETNLHDQNTWNFIQRHQSLGYQIEMKFFYVSSVEILIERVAQRVALGGHFVRDDVINGRYRDGLYYLGKNISTPDKLYIVDASKAEHKFIAELEKGRIIKNVRHLNSEISLIISGGFKKEDEKKKIESIADIRKKYKTQSSKKNKGPNL